jgi:hypothetical protein
MGLRWAALSAVVFALAVPFGVAQGGSSSESIGFWCNGKDVKELPMPASGVRFVAREPGCLAVVKAGELLGLFPLEAGEKLGDIPKPIGSTFELTVTTQNLREFVPQVILEPGPHPLSSACVCAARAAGLAAFSVDWSGTARVGPLPSLPFRLEVVAPYHTQRVIELPGRSQSANLGVVALEPEAHLRVRVAGEEPPYLLKVFTPGSESAVPGVSPWRVASEHKLEDAEGSLVLRPGKVNLLLAKPEVGASSERELALVVGENHVVFELAPIVLEGKVLRAGKPVKAQLSARAPGFASEAAAGEDGAFRLALWQPAQYLVEVSPADAGREVLRVDLRDQKPASVVRRDLVLAERFLEGVVVDATSGQPIAAAELLASQRSAGEVKAVTELSDAQGKFRIGIANDASVSLQASADGYLPARLARSAGEVPQGPVMVRLEKGLLVRGRVVDPTGAPVAGAWVVEAPADPRASLENTAMTGAGGEFTLTCHANAVLFVLAPQPALAWAEARERVEVLVLPPSPPTVIALRDPRGEPVRRAPVMLATKGLVIPRAVSDAAFRKANLSPRSGEHGSVTIGFLPEGSYTLLLDAGRRLVPWGDISLPGPASLVLQGPKPEAAGKP